ncbi:hypothetical protein N7492_001433 [Penicillium capsulatum]|uniref:Uncharacterized protein n=1 Tax=Penicillium capsulatum TaxID=69766 RepID=A0A9W9M153_9EURO|nr:hypothetical protein N7492_001433 [Penicillium capsulatum]
MVGNFMDVLAAAIAHIVGHSIGQGQGHRLVDLHIRQATEHIATDSEALEKPLEEPGVSGAGVLFVWLDAEGLGLLCQADQVLDELEGLGTVPGNGVLLSCLVCNVCQDADEPELLSEVAEGVAALAVAASLHEFCPVLATARLGVVTGGLLKAEAEPAGPEVALETSWAWMDDVVGLCWGVEDVLMRREELEVPENPEVTNWLSPLDDQP